MISLPDVTLLIVDTNARLGEHVLGICQRQIKFGDVVLVTTEQPYSLDVEAPYRVEKIDLAQFKWPNWYCEYCLKYMAAHVRTKFVLMVQYDGFIVNPIVWESEFLTCDYVGATWPWHFDGHTVGNSGFCLRSKKLLDILTTIVHPAPVALDDVYICRVLRPWLEQKHGIAFATDALADRFSYERARVKQPTFGFHGLFNMPAHLSNEEMLRLIPLFPDYVLRKPEYDEMVSLYAERANWRIHRALVERQNELSENRKIG